MSSGSYKQVNVKCPFYKLDTKLSITCEGVTDTCDLSLKFEKPAEKLQQMNIFCCKQYKCCEIFRCIMDAKYIE